MINSSPPPCTSDLLVCILERSYPPPSCRYRITLSKCNKIQYIQTVRETEKETEREKEREREREIERERERSSLLCVVMCSSERTDDSDPTPAIVSPIPITSNSGPQVPHRVGVVQSISESSGVVWSPSRPESSAVVWSRPESSGVIRRRSRQDSFGVVRSQQEPSGVMCVWSNISFRFVFFLSFNLRVHFVYRPLFRRRLWTTSTPTDSQRLPTTPEDFERLRTTPSATPSATPDDSGPGRTYLPESIPKLFESDRTRLRIFANFSHH